MALLEYKCPNCGGAVSFETQIQKLKCPYCETEFDVEALKELDDVLREEKPDDLSWDTQPRSEWQEGEAEALRSYSCKSCAGEIIGDASMAATSCPYCGNPVVVSAQFSGALRPDFVIPFKLDKAAAKKGLMSHFKGKLFLPSFFKNQEYLDEIKGIYVPFWLFDADASGSARFRATKIRFWRDATFNYTETSHYSVYREGSASFERIPVDGSAKIPDDLMESIEPYDFAEAVDFQTAYLAGFLADRYDVTAEQSTERANERVRRSMESSLRSSVKGYASSSVESSSVCISNGKAAYALYPVWLLNTTWQGKRYTFAMNGQTGKFVGDLPIDNKKVWGWRALLLIPFTVAMYFFLDFFTRL